MNGKQKAADIVCGFQIVDKIPKLLLVLGFCHPFSAIENPCSLGRPSIGAERMLKFVSTDAQA
ncbi:hypothetical protein MOD22_10400 [Bacillus haynesii]|uniref:hypothetical protein n=1 Tax=Bacillus haynesii TaxID=1925021 RepID=UPI00227FD948|nr:hypothetical protein [Bacillus haynesii]MCY8542106.1 hypothetical protein [Bacillus haynesii]